MLLKIMLASIQTKFALKQNCTLTVTLFLMSFAIEANADWINLSGAENSPNIAEITVLDDRVNIKFEIFIGNLKTFEDLIPDKLFKDAGAARPPIRERLRHFAENVLSVKDQFGKPLPMQLIRAEPRQRKDRYSPFAGMINPQTRRPVPGAPEDKRVLFTELEYLFQGKPRVVTFSPPKAQSGVSAVNIGFIVYHKTVPVIDFRFLTKDAKLILDWDDPWYSGFSDPVLKRHHQSAMMSFLYVEPREVRHEMLMRLRDLQERFDFGVDGKAGVSADDRAKILDSAGKLLKKSNPVKIDGVSTLPKSVRAQFLEVSLTGLKEVDEQKTIDPVAGIVGVILTYPIDHLPQHVSVDWEFFDDRIERIPTTSIDPAGPYRSFVEESNPTFEWKNFLLKYQEPKVSPVNIDLRTKLNVPVLSAGFSAIALFIIIGFFTGFFKRRNIWVPAFAGCVLAIFGFFKILQVEVPIPRFGPPDQIEGGLVVKAVLDNISAAFIEKDPIEFRKAMSVVAEPASIDKVESEIGRSLAIKIAGGGTASLRETEELKLQNIEALESKSGFRTIASWRVDASAGHWGHPHKRRFEFRALIELTDEKGPWKLSGITVIDAKQL
ncbi:MAG: hypothetical protein ACR2O3_01305 [Rhizobiaceae bacterium]